MMGELEGLIAGKDIGSRAESLRRVTDLFVSGTASFSDDQIALFDEVMSQLAREIDASARAAFGTRLVSMPEAPPRVLREMALDDEIAVAEPVLRGATQLDGATLIEGAKTKSQDHLLAISRRAYLPESVTDVLVERGNREVALSTVGNSGAEFSDHGYATLVERSEVGRGPRGLHVVSKGEPAAASAPIVRECIRERACPSQGRGSRQGRCHSRHGRQGGGAIPGGDAPGVRGICGGGSCRAFLVQIRRSVGDQAADFARAGKFDETTIALSLLSNLPIGLVERAFSQDASEQILVLAKAMGLSWDDTKELLLLKSASKGSTDDDLDRCRTSFGRLESETALKTIRFYRLRERAASGSA